MSDTDIPSTTADTKTRRTRKASIDNARDRSILFSKLNLLTPLNNETQQGPSNVHNTNNHQGHAGHQAHSAHTTTTHGTSHTNYGDRLKQSDKSECGAPQGPTRRKSTKVLQKLHNDDLRSVRSHTELAETANGVRMLAKNLSRATIQLDVRVIMIVTKARDNSLIYLTREVVEWLFSRKGNDVLVYVDHNLERLQRFNAPEIIETFPKAATLLRYWDRKFSLKHPEVFDLVVTLGGDGTVLYVSNLFQRIVPPVMSFSLGSLGFLTNFKFQQFRERMRTVIDLGVKAFLRMRFTCRVHREDGRLVCEQQVLNELVVDRGPLPYVTNLELYGDGSLLTVAQADGLIIATPTGSTAYSLSAGGSLVHPGVSAISVTPICPHTLSFRPILLPDGMFLKVKVPATSRSTAWASFDGKVRTELNKGDYVTIQASPYPFPTVSSSRTEYFDSVSRNLNWNAREQQKPFSLLSDDNRRRYKKKKSKLRMKVSDGMKRMTLEDSPDVGEEVFDIEGEDVDKGEPCGVHGKVQNVQKHVHESADNSSISSSSDNMSSEEGGFEMFDLNYMNDDDLSYLPMPGEGTATPPANSTLLPLEDRTYWAHPNATISLNGALSTTSMSSATHSHAGSKLSMALEKDKSHES